MRFGICTGLDLIEEVKNAGFEYVEMGCHTLIADKAESDFAPVLKTIKSASLPVEAFNNFLPGELKVAGPEVNLEEVGRYIDTVLRRAHEAGASVMVFGSGSARRVDDDFPIDRARDQLEEAARLAAETAAKYDIFIAMEPLFSQACNYFNRVDQGIQLVDRVGHPNLKLLVDLFHFADAGEPFENIVKAGNRLAHVHIATPSLPETGEGMNYDFKSFFQALIKAGYDGRVSVEDNPGLLRGKKPPLGKIYRAIWEFLDSTLRYICAPRGQTLKIKLSSMRLPACFIIIP